MLRAQSSSYYLFDMHKKSQACHLGVLTQSLRWGIKPWQQRHHVKGKNTMAQNDTAKNGNGGNLGFETDLFKAADKLRGNMEPSDYKHVALRTHFPEVHLRRF